MLERKVRAALAQVDAKGLIRSDGVPFGDGDATTPAAVLVAITDRNVPGIILTQRPQTMRSHAGQVAFPGGRIDPTDQDAIAAALREAEEEIALPRAAVRVIGTLPVYRTATAFEITPVIGIVPPDLPLVPNQDEVAAIFEVPLAVVLDVTNYTQATLEWQGHDRHYYELAWGEFWIWGATAALLINLGRTLQW